MDFHYIGRCKKCNTDAGILDGKRVHTVAALIFTVKTYREGKVFCESPIFDGEEEIIAKLLEENTNLKKMNNALSLDLDNAVEGEF